MARIRPFRGVLYNGEKINDLADVIAPPYDIIPEHLRRKLYRRHPHNIVRLILGRIQASDGEGNNRYTRAGKFFESWLKKRVLLQDGKAALYVYSQLYREEAKEMERVGFIGLIKLSTERRSKLRPLPDNPPSPQLCIINLVSLG